MAKSAPGTSTPKPGAAHRKAAERAARVAPAPKAPDARTPTRNPPPSAKRTETARRAFSTDTRPKAAAAVPGRGAVDVVTPGARVRVMATEPGYYDHARRRVGDVFTMAVLDLDGGRPKPGGGVSRPCSWVEEVDPRTPERLTGAQDNINRQHDEILGGRVAGDRSSEPPTRAVDDDDDMLKG